MRSSLSKVLFCGFLSLICARQSVAQSALQHDLALLQQQAQAEKAIIEPERKITFNQQWNPLSWIYQGGVAFYQKNVSMQIAANCIFETTCSHFSKALVQEFGVLGGSLLTVERLSRCNRISLVETSPLHFNKSGKLVDRVDTYRFK